MVDVISSSSLHREEGTQAVAEHLASPAPRHAHEESGGGPVIVVVVAVGVADRWGEAAEMATSSSSSSSSEAYSPSWTLHTSTVW